MVARNVQKLIVGRDGVIRGAVLRSDRDKIERALQHLFPMELSCDSKPQERSLNPVAQPFSPRIRRQAAIRSEERTREVINYENTDPEVEF